MAIFLLWKNSWGLLMKGQQGMVQQWQQQRLQVPLVAVLVEHLELDPLLVVVAFLVLHPGGLLPVVACLVLRQGVLLHLLVVVSLEQLLHLLLVAGCLVHRQLLLLEVVGYSVVLVGLLGLHQRSEEILPHQWQTPERRAERVAENRVNHWKVRLRSRLPTCNPCQRLVSQPKFRV